jgi:flavin reductase (DIM6/NTAB) family NADH-FMN oxidoreductase RutF
MNKNFKAEKRMVVFLHREERQAVKIASAKSGKNLNEFQRSALLSECEKYGIDFETGEVKK